ncbi:unnamed protein product [Effrenium voratum]|nr:unnamed protein product [Effrenium voratum]
MLSPGRRGPIQPHRFVHPAGYSPVQVYQADCWRQTRVVRQTLVDNSAKVGLPFQAGACGSFTARPEGRACPSAPGPSPPASEEERISALLASVFQRPPEETEPVRPKQLEVRPKGSGFHGARAPAKVLCTPPSPLPQSRVTQMPRSASYQPPVNPTLLAARQPSVPRGYLQAALRPEVAQQSLEQALEAQKPAGGSSGEVNTCELEKVEPLDVSLEEPPKEVPDTGLVFRYSSAGPFKGRPPLPVFPSFCGFAAKGVILPLAPTFNCLEGLVQFDAKQKRGSWLPRMSVPKATGRTSHIELVNPLVTCTWR